MQFICTKLVQRNLTPLHQTLDKECPRVPAQKERPQVPTKTTPQVEDGQRAGSRANKLA